MPKKPYFRTVRSNKDGPNAGYSSWAYIRDMDYAKSPAHYIRAYLLIEKDLNKLFEYIEPSEEANRVYSYRIHELLMRTCIEVEANFKAILSANIFSGVDNATMTEYKKVDVSHHLSSYKVKLPIWNSTEKLIAPFLPWKTGESISWYQAYNKSKHNRLAKFKEANFEALVSAVAGLVVLISSQFRDQDFSGRPDSLIMESSTGDGMEPAVGNLFRVSYPKDWKDDELYDFDWAELKTETARFEKFNYNEN